MKARLFVSLLLLGSLVSCTQQVKIVAHRGYWKADGAVQNSIASLRAAGELGVYGSEFDVWLTADGRLVVNHDSMFHELSMTESTLDELRQFSLDNGEPIPTLEEYLEAAKEYPSLTLVLELKSNYDGSYDEAAVSKILEVVSQSGISSRVAFISFSYVACQLYAEKSPGSMVQYLGCDRAVGALHSAGIMGIDAHYSLYETYPETVKTAHELGMSVNVWTVDDLALARHLKSLGVDMITTDEPAVFLEEL